MATAKKQVGKRGRDKQARKPRAEAGVRGLDRRKRAQKPKTAGLVLEHHPLFEEVIALLRERWTGASIRAALIDRYRDRFETEGGSYAPLPSSRTIDRYAKNHAERIRPTGPGPNDAIDKRDLVVHTRIDLLRSLERQYESAEARLERAFASETKDGKGIPLKITDDAQATLDRIAGRLVDVQLKLGLYNPFREQMEMDLTRITSVAWAKGTKFTEARRNHILTLVAEGVYRSTAAFYAGITPQTLYRWLGQGETDLEAAEALEIAEKAWKHTEYSLFLIQMGMAEATAEVAALRVIQRAWSSDYKAAIFFLERTRPEKFARVDWRVTEIASVVAWAGEELGMDADEQALVSRLTEEHLRGMTRRALPEGKRT